MNRNPPSVILPVAAFGLTVFIGLIKNLDANSPGLVALFLLALVGTVLTTFRGLERAQRGMSAEAVLQGSASRLAGRGQPTRDACRPACPSSGLVDDGQADRRTVIIGYEHRLAAVFKMTIRFRRPARGAGGQMPRTSPLVVVLSAHVHHRGQPLIA